MKCPTCSGTMAKLCDADDGSHFHCERCGTARLRADEGWIEDYVPKLVERLRRFRDEQCVCTIDKSLWHRLGIDECIRTEEERKET